MRNEKLTEKQLNEGLELLSSENSKKQKIGFGSLRAASALGNMKAVYYEGICYKERIEIYKFIF